MKGLTSLPLKNRFNAQKETNYIISIATATTFHYQVTFIDMHVIEVSSYKTGQKVKTHTTSC